MRKFISIGACAMALAAAQGAIQASTALAVSAPIHITQDVNLRAGTNSSTARVGGIYAGASPDFNCWAQGQNINGVDVWLNQPKGIRSSTTPTCSSRASNSGAGGGDLITAPDSVLHSPGATL